MAGCGGAGSSFTKLVEKMIAKKDDGDLVEINSFGERELSRKFSYRGASGLLTYDKPFPVC